MLNDEQKQEVSKWFADGASLDEIQKRLKGEFGVHITYLDLRLLVADLPQPVDPEPVADDSGARSDVADGGMPPLPGDDDVGADAGADVPPAAADPAAPAPKRDDLDAPNADQGKPVPDVAVELDALTIPGTFASGDVTFSDGTKAKWYLDQQGRLGLGDAPEGFRPTPTDAALFQTRLMELLRSRGMM